MTIAQENEGWSGDFQGILILMCYEILTFFPCDFMIIVFTSKDILQ